MTNLTPNERLYCDMMGIEPEPDRSNIPAELDDTVPYLMRQLLPVEQDVLRYYYEDDESDRTIAIRLNTTPIVIRATVRRALDKLRARPENRRLLRDGIGTIAKKVELYDMWLQNVRDKERINLNRLRGELTDLTQAKAITPNDPKNASIRDLPVLVRTYNVLRCNGCKTVQDVIDKKDKWENFRGAGKTTVTDIQNALARSPWADCPPTSDMEETSPDITPMLSAIAYLNAYDVKTPALALLMALYNTSSINHFSHPALTFLLRVANTIYDEMNETDVPEFSMFDYMDAILSHISDTRDAGLVSFRTEWDNRTKHEQYEYALRLAMERRHPDAD